MSNCRLVVRLLDWIIVTLNRTGPNTERRLRIIDSARWTVVLEHTILLTVFTKVTHIHASKVRGRKEDYKVRNLILCNLRSLICQTNSPVERRTVFALKEAFRFANELVWIRSGRRNGGR